MNKMIATPPDIRQPGCEKELSTQALVEFDTETRFLARAQRGTNRVERGLELLRKAQGIDA